LIAKSSVIWLNNILTLCPTLIPCFIKGKIDA
jgi:hypothetical protein